MNNFETVYFPETTIFSHRQSPLFLLFSSINLVSLIEQDASSLSHNSDVSLFENQCTIHVPHPLGNDKDRFNYLINDIKNRKDDYAGQLSNIALASLSRDQVKSDPGHTIVSSIVGKSQKNIQRDAITPEDKLWHARLILKIAEILDQEEEEVAKSLLYLTESEQSLFKTLQGDDTDREVDNLYHDIIQLKTLLSKPSSESMDNRLRSWFAYTRSYSFPLCPVWTTTRKEVLDILSENHMNSTGALPQCTMSFSVPLHLGGNSQQTIDHLFDWKEQFSSLTTELLFSGLSDSCDSNQQDQLMERYTNALDSHYPAQEFGRNFGSIYHFHDSWLRSSATHNTDERQAPHYLLHLEI